LAIFTGMKERLKNAIALALVPQIGLVLWLRGQPQWVETWYSNGVYPHIASFFHRLYGWVPFSVGDCLYALLIASGIIYVVKNRVKIRRKPLVFLRDVILVLSVAYFSFNLLWGLNYYREPLQKKLQLEEAYSPKELITLSGKLIERTNELQFRLTADSIRPVAMPYDRQTILQETLESYTMIGRVYPFLQYRRPSIKISLFSTLLTYMGYGGYLNPFTNEAQVNGKIPAFRYPVICGHEIGHQLGYSAENETNFIGYLVTAQSEDPYFQYSASAYAASYCLAEVRRRDPATYARLYARFNPGVRRNFEELESFWKGYENPTEPVFKGIFNTFLKANNQKEGIRSYNGIVALLVAYHRTHPL